MANKRLSSEISASVEQASGSLKAELTGSLSGVFNSDGTVIKTADGGAADPISYGMFKVIDKQRIHMELIRKDIERTNDFVSHSLGIDGNEFRTLKEKITDWTADQGSTNIHANNYTNTTYSVQDGGLTQNNFTNTLKSKLDGIEASADVTDASNVNSAGALMRTGGTMTGPIYNTLNVFTAGDATPAVNGGSIFKTANTDRASADITAFDGGISGQEITIMIADNYTDFTHGGGRATGDLSLSSGVDWDTSAKGDTITFVCDGKWWYEKCRSDNTR
jgi:hypothetical protein